MNKRDADIVLDVRYELAKLVGPFVAVQFIGISAIYCFYGLSKGWLASSYTPMLVIGALCFAPLYLHVTAFFLVRCFDQKYFVLYSDGSATWMPVLREQWLKYPSDVTWRIESHAIHLSPPIAPEFVIKLPATVTVTKPKPV